jgi:hypothetical protein
MKYVVYEQIAIFTVDYLQWLATGQWFSPGPPVSSTNKTDRHNITEIYQTQSKKQTNIYW